eukprot:5512169-Prymnesium_polylepis.1
MLASVIVIICSSCVRDVRPSGYMMKHSTPFLPRSPWMAELPVSPDVAPSTVIFWPGRCDTPAEGQGRVRGARLAPPSGERSEEREGPPQSGARTCAGRNNNAGTGVAAGGRACARAAGRATCASPRRRARAWLRRCSKRFPRNCSATSLNANVGPWKSSSVCMPSVIGTTGVTSRSRNVA